MRSILFEYAPNGTYQLTVYYSPREAENRLMEICLKGDSDYRIFHDKTTWADVGCLGFMALDEETAFENGNYIGISGESRKFMSADSPECFDKTYQVYSKADIFGKSSVYEQEDQFLKAEKERTDFMLTSGCIGNVIYDYEFDRSHKISFDASRYIESVLLGIPLSPVIVSYDKSIIDGNQRIRVLRDFIECRFRLEGLETLSRLNGSYFNDLPHIIKTKLTGRFLRLYIYGPKTSEEAKTDIAKRANF